MIRRLMMLAAAAAGGYYIYSVIRKEGAQQRLKENVSTAAFNPALTPEVAEEIGKEIPAATGLDRNL
jgi:hypothetical protein